MGLLVGARGAARRAARLGGRFAAGLFAAGLGRRLAAGLPVAGRSPIGAAFFGRHVGGRAPAATVSAAGSADDFDGLSSGRRVLLVRLAVHVKRMSVQVDGTSFTGQARDIRVAFERPGRPARKLDIDRTSSTAGIDGALER